jgi:ribosomal protein L7Ae/L30e/S12e/gadd45 family
MQKNNKEKNTVKRKLVLEVDRLVKQKYLNLIGFAAKSGKIAYGEEDVLNGIEKGKISLTIIAKDMPEKAKNRMEKKLIHAYENLYFEVSGLKKKEDIRVIIVGTKEENSSAVGKVNKPVIGIKDRNLAKGIITSILEEIDGE